MQCREVESIIPSYLKGEETETVTLIDSHLAECKSCREMADVMKNVSKNLANIPVIKPEKGYLAKIHNRIQKTSPEVVKGPGETTTRLEAVGKISKRLSLSSRNKKRVELSLFEKINFYIVNKLKTPAFAYAFAIHLVVLGLCVFLYRAEIKNSNNRPGDVQSLRYAAFDSRVDQTVFMGKIKLEGLGLLQNGEVYITQTSRCIQVQLNKPLSGNFAVASVVNGELKLDQTLIDKYFSDNNVTILKFNGAVEVWSRSSLEEYILTNPNILKPA